jgi:MYXO-CTERM domain-containing protein
VAVALAVVAPWTIRNHHVLGGFVPISLQDAAAYGVFNDDSANDKERPWQWRPLPRRDVALFARNHPRSDVSLRKELIKRARTYVEDHPSSVPKAFFWNGIVRTWDLRSPSDALLEVPFEGRTRSVARVAFYSYWVLGLLALAGLWFIRRRKGVVLPLAAIAFASAVVFTTDGGTRYRAPLEPVIVILACVGAERLVAARRRTPAAVPTWR